MIDYNSISIVSTLSNPWLKSLIVRYFITLKTHGYITVFICYTKQNNRFALKYKV